jgi:FixJ family two-component response regulator
MINAGAFDFFEKPHQDHVLLDRINAALRQNAEVHRWYARRLDAEARIGALTPGERIVLDEIMKGSSYKTIARDLGISYKTVQARRDQIMKKTGAIDLPNLIRTVLEIQLVKPSGPKSQHREHAG